MPGYGQQPDSLGGRRRIVRRKSLSAEETRERRLRYREGDEYERRPDLPEGLRQRRIQSPETATGATSPEARAREAAQQRQENVARDKPAVKGSLRPSEIRERAKRMRAAIGARLRRG